MPKEIKKGPEDIFADEMIFPPLPSKEKEPPLQTFRVPSSKKPGKNFRTLFKVIIIIAVVLLILVIGWLIYSQRGTEKTTRQPGLPANFNAQPTIQDADFDGLTDQEERALRTNPNSIDTDQDGLFDKEEVKIYQTDPLNPDSDGDGLSDGKEVRAGLDPKNPAPGARLFNLQDEINKMGE